MVASSGQSRKAIFAVPLGRRGLLAPSRQMRLRKEVVRLQGARRGFRGVQEITNALVTKKQLGVEKIQGGRVGVQGGRPGG